MSEDVRSYVRIMFHGGDHSKKVIFIHRHSSNVTTWGHHKIIQIFGDFHIWGYPKLAGWLISWKILLKSRFGFSHGALLTFPSLHKPSESPLQFARKKWFALPRFLLGCKNMSLHKSWNANEQKSAAHPQQRLVTRGLSLFYSICFHQFSKKTTFRVVCQKIQKVYHH